MTKTIFTYLIMILALPITSCTGEDGANGMDGMDGADGQDGNANVIASDWIPTDFIAGAVFVTAFNVEDANINDTNVNTAAILAFGQIGASAVPIPFVFSNRSYYFILFPNINIIRFVGTVADGTGTQVFDDIDAVRYVIIPPAEGRGASTTPEDIIQNLINKGVDVTDYGAVAKYFNIQ
ncbi:MAG: hypothetical protein ACPG7E_07040 [Marinirhabdus sp.]